MIYIIDQADFTPYVEMTANLDFSRLRPAIFTFQTVDLPELLGEALAADFMEKLEASRLDTDPVALTTDYQNLYDKLKPWAVYAAYARFVPFASVRATNTGMVFKQHENSENIDPKTIALIVDDANNNALVLKKNLVKFIEANLDKYPLYPKPENTCYPEVKASRTSALGKCDPSDFLRIQEA